MTDLIKKLRAKCELYEELLLDAGLDGDEINGAAFEHRRLRPLLDSLLEFVDASEYVLIKDSEFLLATSSGFRNSMFFHDALGKLQKALDKLAGLLNVSDVVVEAQMTKPREWWIHPEVRNSCLIEVLDFDPVPAKECVKPYINVIEKSAYIELMSEAMKLRAELEKVYDKAMSGTNQVSIDVSIETNKALRIFNEWLADRGNDNA